MNINRIYINTLFTVIYTQNNIFDEQFLCMQIELTVAIPGKIFTESIFYPRCWKAWLV